MIDRKIEVALVTICYFILVTLIFQIFAVVNQRRYRSAFYAAFVTLLLSILLSFNTMRYLTKKAKYVNDDKELTDD